MFIVTLSGKSLKKISNGDNSNRVVNPGLPVPNEDDNLGISSRMQDELGANGALECKTSVTDIFDSDRSCSEAQSKFCSISSKFDTES